MKPNIAVVGMGCWGTNLVRAFRNLKALHSICDTRDAAGTAQENAPLPPKLTIGTMPYVDFKANHL